MTQPQTLDLIAHLQPIPDYRKAKGRRHDRWLLLMLVLLGTLCGDRGYRPLADCSVQHWPSLCALLDVPTDTRIPSYSTCRRVLQHVDFAPLVTLFNQWRQHFIPVAAPTWVAADGKSIKSTLTDDSAAAPNWVMTVAAFTQQTGVVLH